MPQISRDSGVHIVTGTGYYVKSFLPDYAKTLSSNQMADAMYREIVEGCGPDSVKCGIIGEMGCSYPLEDTEKAALQAAAIVQTRTGTSALHVLCSEVVCCWILIMSFVDNVLCREV